MLPRERSTTSDPTAAKRSLWMVTDGRASTTRLSRNDRIDGVVAGVGGSNTTYTLKSATQDGGLSKTGSPFATLYSTAGISLALGKGKFYFVLEGGMDSQKVESLERTGTMNNNVNEIDLSGAYFNIGVMFDGIPIEM